MGEVGKWGVGIMNYEWFFGLCYAMDWGYRGWNPYVEKHLAIFVNCFYLKRTHQLSLLPEKDLVNLCPPIEPQQVTKSHKNNLLPTASSSQQGH